MPQSQACLQVACSINTINDFCSIALLTVAKYCHKCISDRVCDYLGRNKKLIAVAVPKGPRQVQLTDIYARVTGFLQVACYVDIVAALQYYKNITIINDNSRIVNYLLERLINYAPRVMPQFGESL